MKEPKTKIREGEIVTIDMTIQVDDKGTSDIRRKITRRKVNVKN